MLIFTLTALSSLLVCFALTPFLRDFFTFLDVVDKPDSHRKLHLRPVPRLGGIGLMVAYSVAVIAMVLGWYGDVFDSGDPSVDLLVRLFPAVLLVFATGLYDDLRGLSPWKKLAGQTAAAAYACWAGVHPVVRPQYSHLALVIYVISVLWLVLCANAFNLIDGLDGLATGVALIASTSILMAALIHHNPTLALAIAPLVGALLGFLYYNFNPASIFLGDCGSLLVGFLLGCYGIMWNQHAQTGLAWVAPLIALALPVFEVMLSIVRRVLRDRPIFSSDSSHIHHRILSRGLTHRKAALVLYGAAALVGFVSVLLTILRPRLAIVALLLLLGAAVVGLRSLRYTELNILGRFLFQGTLGTILRTSIYLAEFEEAMAAADTLDGCWAALRNACREAGFTYVALSFKGRSFEDTLRPSDVPANRLAIALSQSDSATFAYARSLPGPAMLMAPLAGRLQEKLRALSSSVSWFAADEHGLKASSAAR